jgi:hypothetical protein
VRATITNISEEDIIDCFYNGLTDPGIYRDFEWNRPKTIARLHDMMHDWSEQEEKMRERFPRRNDNNPSRTNDNRTDKSQTTSSWLWIILREAGRQQRKSSSKSSCRRNAHGIQVPIVRQSIATTSEGHSAIPAM